MAVVEHQLTGREARLDGVEVELGGVGDGVPRRQVLGLDLQSAARAIELEDAYPLRIGREGELARDQRWVDLGRVTLGDQQPALDVVARVAEILAALAADPALGFEVEIEPIADV